MGVSAPLGKRRGAEESRLILASSGRCWRCWAWPWQPVCLRGPPLRLSRHGDPWVVLSLRAAIASVIVTGVAHPGSQSTIGRHFSWAPRAWRLPKESLSLLSLWIRAVARSPTGGFASSQCWQGCTWYKGQRLKSCYCCRCSTPLLERIPDCWFPVHQGCHHPQRNCGPLPPRVGNFRSTHDRCLDS